MNVAFQHLNEYCRSTMTELRLIDLAILSIEKDLLTTIHLDTVVHIFSSSDKNRRIAKLMVNTV